ncbi:hypothetical protein PgNI_10084 [Pyricularia grisea]|uniref:Phytase A n=1 Tax=Pyricularia grisea TaxID=148305 RepID=A0A6P8AXE2_PYRGI|nr:hypothetical protein PgNI_10084 [Pyricularia grisea]TLD07002.1 hypothetical protein PgNI_10084 [Pyricularia grisea]
MPAIAADSHTNLNNFDTADRGFLYRPDITYNWGHLSPFHSLSSEYNPSTPLPGCTVTFVQSLTRHGSRYPKLENKYNTIIQRIQSSVNNYGAGFEFIRNYKTNLPSETLNNLGRHQLVNAGMHFYRRYQSLAKNNQPFIRYDEADRVVESGEKWAYGFHLASLADKTRIGPDKLPYPTVKLPSGKGLNNTLNNKGCPKRDQARPEAIVKGLLARHLTGVTNRVNQNLSGANLSIKEVFELMELCAMETMGTIATAGRLSQICTIFNRQEWQAFNRYHNEMKWYTYFYGNPLAPSLGVGWVNELIARLLQRPVRDSTSTNTTLTANPETFPLNRKLYADFTHATDFLQIYAALGLLGSTHNPVPANRIVSNQRLAEFSISEVSPFAARMYVEKMTCSGHKEELVRILVNNRVMWLPHCGADGEGRCKLGAFVESLSFARSGGFWKKCF